MNDTKYSPITSKKIKFRSVSTTEDPLLGQSRIEDLSLHRPRSKSEHKYKKKESHSSDYCDEKEAPSLLGFLGVELTRGYALEHDEEQYSAKREKVYSFMSVPREVEKFMIYGFFQCADSFLFVYTFLPMRFLLAFWAMITRPIKKCFGHKTKSLLTPAEICDLLKASLLVVCSVFMFYVDTSIMYHLIKSQSVIKLYIFFNMLEVGDRLFSAFGQDIIDALFWTATEPRGRRRDHFGVIPHYLFAIIYVFLHALLVLCQATTLNVAINSNNKALLTIMMSNNVLHAFLVLWQATTLNVAINSNNKALLTIMISNNFVELKGSVFKKFDKNNLFQVACSDVRERFHLFVLLSIVVLQTMKEYAWKEETLWVMVPDCLMVLMSEVVVDWIKHAFITRFNELPVEVYRDYRLSLAYDMAQTRQKNAFTDHSDLVARRMGFIPLPLGVVMVRVLGYAVRVQGLPAVSLAVLGYFCLASFKVLNNVLLLGKACDLIYHHQQEKSQQDTSSPVRFIKDSATSPTRPQVIRSPSPSLRRSATVGGTVEPIKRSTSHNSNVTNEHLPSLGSPAIFSNSAVSIADVCLNEEMLKVGVGAQLESIGEVESDCLTRSVPNIQQETESEMPMLSRSASPSPELGKKRAESEPSIPHLIENEILEMQLANSNS